MHQQLQEQQKSSCPKYRYLANLNHGLKHGTSLMLASISYSLCLYWETEREWQKWAGVRVAAAKGAGPKGQQLKGQSQRGRAKGASDQRGMAKGASDQRGIAKGEWPKGHDQRGTAKGAWLKGHLIQKGHCCRNDQISSPNQLHIRSPGILFLNFALGDKG